MAVVAIEIPDELSNAITSPGFELSRSAFEAIALEAYREHKLTTSQLRRMLGFADRYELDGFLKSRGVWLDYGPDDLEYDRETHLRLGL